jgi:hypothetical protein
MASAETPWSQRPITRPRHFCTRPALVHGAEMAESRGRTSGCVARPARDCRAGIARRPFRSKLPAQSDRQADDCSAYLSKNRNFMEALESYIAFVPAQREPPIAGRVVLHTASSAAALDHLDVVYKRGSGAKTAPSRGPPASKAATSTANRASAVSDGPRLPRRNCATTFRPVLATNDASRVRFPFYSANATSPSRASSWLFERQAEQSSACRSL